MDLLFKREQSNTSSGGVTFKLWSKIEFNEEEQAIVSRYKFDKAILILSEQSGLLRRSIVAGALALVVAVVVLIQFGTIGILSAFAVGLGFGYWRYHQLRETIFVKDLIHGRQFTCSSVVELAQKEAWLETVVSFLRQVMESAKHWDGTERHRVEPLPKDEARQVIIKGG